MPSATSAARPASHAWRKLAAILIVVSSLTVGVVGVGLATAGNLWALVLCLVTPLGIWIATRILPPAGTTPYLEKNL